jgi:hypothetical protein
MIMGKFSQMIVEQSDVLHLSREQVTQLMQGGKKYQQSIPVCATGLPLHTACVQWKTSY